MTSFWPRHFSLSLQSSSLTKTLPTPSHSSKFKSSILSVNFHILRRPRILSSPTVHLKSPENVSLLSTSTFLLNLIPSLTSLSWFLFVSVVTPSVLLQGTEDPVDRCWIRGSPFHFNTIRRQKLYPFHRTNRSTRVTLLVFPEYFIFSPSVFSFLVSAVILFPNQVTTTTETSTFFSGVRFLPPDRDLLPFPFLWL